jgi:hypothetical protein
MLPGLDVGELVESGDINPVGELVGEVIPVGSVVGEEVEPPPGTDKPPGASSPPGA